MTVVQTDFGPAEYDLSRPAGRPRTLLVLGHGAGGGVNTPDLTAVRDAVLPAGVAVALVTQPYRVAGRRSAPPAKNLDAAWVEVVAAVRADAGQKLPVVLGGRSSGARVACRTARTLGAVGVVGLAFPLHPPGRPNVTRADELDPELPTLIVNGDRDPFGMPAAAGLIEVSVRPGDRHDLRKDPPAVAAAVLDWLRRHRWASKVTARK